MDDSHKSQVTSRRLPVFKRRSLIFKRRSLIWLSVAIGVALLAATTIDAHKGITSKYTYNDDVYPILRDKCGHCHAEGGSAPMSLLKYDIESGGAAAWAESIRENLVSEAMPPWYADPTGPAVKNQARHWAFFRPGVATAGADNAVVFQLLDDVGARTRNARSNKERRV